MTSEGGGEPQVKSIVRISMAPPAGRGHLSAILSKGVGTATWRVKSQDAH